MIEIKCTGSDNIKLKDIKDFQGDLKKRSLSSMVKLKASIEKYGFSFPFFIWKDEGWNWCLDGHGRIQALKEMGAQEQEFPVVYIEAKDEEEAKKKLLQMNSQYGELDKEGFLDFIDNIEFEVEEYSLMGVEEFLAEEEKKEKPEVEFTKELLEAHNYVVLYFENDIDWLQAQTFFDLKTVASKRTNGKEWSRGIGRVVDGAEYIRKMS